MKDPVPQKLTQLPKDTRVLLQSFANPEVGTRLMSMGLLPGSELEIKCVAPFKGGYCVKINSQTIALRYSEAESLLVSQVSAPTALP